ncbi:MULTISPECIES: alpha/beta hydrolase [Paraburkholderia]|uniref:Alpha/beta hydrolase n=1 Tax=Paraburkholderia podalyriae TaxID=1938811 RepID=A0ABR7PZB4_9BURK|nr:alpha/beta hydrolase [Paraburkholderia podalyriae]MBC8751593.1 alpha/beta hydrolase [Paraburkholderia podalyriae]
MNKRRDIEFKTRDGLTLRGWLFVPEGDGTRFPAISMSHGFAAVKEHGLAPFAEAFADAGFVVLVHDHRNFGASDGLPRQDIDPWVQVNDWRCAISWLETRPEVDADRIGIWGSSYSGGHALVLGATDRRLKCVVSQVPTISGYEQGRRRVSPDALPAFEQLQLDDLRARHRGESPRMPAVVSGNPAELAAYRAPDSVAFYTQALPEGAWSNTVTLRSTFAARMYEPGIWAERISPTPLLMIVATHDGVTMTDLELQAYERALQPKRLKLIPGGHFDPYGASLDEARLAATACFLEHLVH